MNGAVNNDKKNTIWNAIAGLINAGEAVIVLMIVTRVNGIGVAGMFSLAFSLANLFITIGKYGVKNYQVIHGEQQIRLKTYISFRKITTILMYLTFVAYVMVGRFLNSYSMEKLLIIMIVCIWYGLEAYEDVYLAKHQLEGNLYLGSQMFIIRWVCILGTFILFDLVTKAVILSLLISLAVGIIISFACIAITRKQYQESLDVENYMTTNDSVGFLAKECFPLFLAEFAYFYMNNMAKYSLARYQSDEIQAIYGFIAMPIFAIPLLNSFLYQPKLVETAVVWKNGRVDLFLRKIYRQLFVIVVLAVVCLMGAYILGIPVLSALYQVDLSPYKYSLLILLVGGSFLAATGYLSTMITVIGKQTHIIYCYLFSIVIGQAITEYLAKKYSIVGVANAYMISIFILTLTMFIVLMHSIKKIDA